MIAWSRQTLHNDRINFTRLIHGVSNAFDCNHLHDIPVRGFDKDSCVTQREIVTDVLGSNYLHC